MKCKFFKQSDFSMLLQEANNAENGISRRLLHESTEALMQYMLIAFRPNLSYPFIKDNIEGYIAYNCLYGSLTIEIIATGNMAIEPPLTHKLYPGDIIYFPRSYWRKTNSYDDGAIFTESIEGTFKKDLREILNSDLST